jgi:cytochrome c-type biogenesis protein CcmH
MLRGPILALLTLLSAAGVALAVEPDERLADAVLEARAVALSKQLRCVVCQSQNIDDSDAMLARDLRLLLRERIAAGDTDEEALAFVVDRYGEFVLLKPPVRADTALLWLAPALTLLIGGGAAFMLLRSRRNPVPQGDA